MVKALSQPSITTFLKLKYVKKFTPLRRVAGSNKNLAGNLLFLGWANQGYRYAEVHQFNTEWHIRGIQNIIQMLPSA